MEIKCEQRSDEWLAARCGKLTASTFPKLIRKPKARAEWTEGQLTILHAAAAEIITGVAEPEGYTSQAMQDGIDNEDCGRDLWAIENFETARKCGFFQHSEYIGGSPDFIIIRDGEDWGVGEMKAPMSKQHLKYELDRDELFKEYGGQVLGNCLAAGLPNFVLVSFDPRFPDGRQFVTYTGRFKPEELAVLESRLMDAVTLIKEWI